MQCSVQCLALCMTLTTSLCWTVLSSTPATLRHHWIGLTAVERNLTRTTPRLYRLSRKFTSHCNLRHTDFRPHSTYCVDAAYCYRCRTSRKTVCVSVCLYVCVFVCWYNTNVLYNNGKTDWNATCEADSYGSREPCIRWGSRSHGMEQFWGLCGPIEKHWGSVFAVKGVIQSLVSRTAILGVTLHCPPWKIRLLATRPFVEILWPLVIFLQLPLVTITDGLSLLCYLRVRCFSAFQFVWTVSHFTLGQSLWKLWISSCGASS